MSDGLSLVPAPHRSQRPWLWMLASLVFALGFIGFWFIAAKVGDERDQARAELKDLQDKLTHSQDDRIACLSQNIDLSSWKVQAQITMEDSFAVAAACVKALPPGTRLHIHFRRHFPDYAPDTGSGGSAPQ